MHRIRQLKWLSRSTRTFLMEWNGNLVPSLLVRACGVLLLPHTVAWDLHIISFWWRTYNFFTWFLWALCSREILIAIGHFSLCQKRAKDSKFFASFSCWPGHPATARCVRGSCRNFWHCAARDRNYQDGRGSVRHSFSICHRRNSILVQLMANELSHHIEGFYLSWNSYFCVRNLAGY